MTTERERIERALDIARDGMPDGDHHRAWVIDQMVRALTDCPTIQATAFDHRREAYTYPALGESDEYLAFVAVRRDSWSEGVAP